MQRGLTRRLPLGSWFGLKLTFSWLAVIWYLVAVALFGYLATWFLALTFTDALLAGILSALIVAVSDLVHQNGHALAAQRVGYPMIGIHFYSIFAGSVYPRDEPPLPPRTHILRALGGFWVNVLIGLVLLPVALAVWPNGGVLAWVAAFAVVSNLFVIGLGALMPIDIPGVFTIDGGTILRNWREIQKENKT